MKLRWSVWFSHVRCSRGEWLSFLGRGGVLWCRSYSLESWSRVSVNLFINTFFSSRPTAPASGRRLICCQSQGSPGNWNGWLSVANGWTGLECRRYTSRRCRADTLTLSERCVTLRFLSCMNGLRCFWNSYYPVSLFDGRRADSVPWDMLRRHLQPCPVWSRFLEVVEPFSASYACWCRLRTRRGRHLAATTPLFGTPVEGTRCVLHTQRLIWFHHVCRHELSSSDVFPCPEVDQSVFGTSVIERWLYFRRGVCSVNDGASY